MYNKDLKSTLIVTFSYGKKRKWVGLRTFLYLTHGPHCSPENQYNSINLVMIIPQCNDNITLIRIECSFICKT